MKVIVIGEPGIAFSLLQLLTTRGIEVIHVSDPKENHEQYQAELINHLTI